MRLRAVVLVLAVGCSGEDAATDDTGGEPSPTSFVECDSAPEAEVFLGLGVGGAFELLEEGEALGLTAAPQGGFGVSVLVGTRGLLAGPEEVVMADLTAESTAVENSAATFTLDAALDCKSDGPDGPQGVIYGVVVGFASSLSSTDLLVMNGQPANLTVAVTDAVGNTAEVAHTVTLIVGE